MAFTSGQVQRIFMDANDTNACVFIGPTPANVELLFVQRRASDPAHTLAAVTSMLDALGQALAARRDVKVGHDDSDANIFSVEMR